MSLHGDDWFFVDAHSARIEFLPTHQENTVALSVSVLLGNVRVRAFGQLIGIDPDYRLHIADRLQVQNDGPTLEALKRLNGGMIHLPNRAKDRPDRDRLAQRYERFKAAA